MIYADKQNISSDIVWLLCEQKPVVYKDVPRGYLLHTCNDFYVCHNCEETDSA